MKHEESAIQCSIVDALSLHGVYYFSVPNERKGTVQQMARMVHMGLRAGVSDLVLIGPDGVAYFLEIKTATGRLSDAQKKFQALCEKKGWHYAVARSVDEAMLQARDWALIK